MDEVSGIIPYCSHPKKNTVVSYKKKSHKVVFSLSQSRSSYLLVSIRRVYTTITYANGTVLLLIKLTKFTLG